VRNAIKENLFSLTNLTSILSWKERRNSAPSPFQEKAGMRLEKLQKYVVYAKLNQLWQAIKSIK
jgi:hypothetical protein